MPLQGSGQISISNIVGELYQVSPANDSDRSLASLTFDANNSDPCNTGSLPASSAAPFAMSEFYNYDHHCTTGPTLTQCNVAGPFGSDSEACGFGPGQCEFDPITVWVTGTCCAQMGDTFYLDSNGATPLGAGIYYLCDCLTAQAVELDDNGQVIMQYFCGGGKGGGFEEP
jgi:hypothetical protein